MLKPYKLIFLACIVSVALVMGSMAVSKIVAAGETTVENLSEIEEADEYLIKSHGGYVAVYYDSHGYPAWIGDTPLSSLREYDRELLDKGLTVTSKQELLQILEDLEC